MAGQKLVVNFEDERISCSAATEIGDMLRAFFMAPGRLEQFEEWRAKRKEGVVNGEKQMLLVQ